MALVHPTKSGSKAYEKVVLKEDSESHKIRMKADDIHEKSQGISEVNIFFLFAIIW